MGLAARLVGKVLAVANQSGKCRDVTGYRSGLPRLLRNYAGSGSKLPHRPSQFDASFDGSRTNRGWGLSSEPGSGLALLRLSMGFTPRGSFRGDANRGGRSDVGEALRFERLALRIDHARRGRSFRWSSRMIEESGAARARPHLSTSRFGTLARGCDPQSPLIGQDVRNKEPNCQLWPSPWAPLSRRWVRRGQVFERSDSGGSEGASGLAASAERT